MGIPYVAHPNDMGTLTIQGPPVGWDKMDSADLTAAMQNIADRFVPDGQPYIITDTDTNKLPGMGRKLFFKAWVLSNGKVEIDYDKARIIQMDSIRRVRNVELERESGSKFRQPPEIEATFTAERQATLQTLRDIPQTFDLTTDVDTPEKLEAKWPSELPARE